MTAGCTWLDVLDRYVASASAAAIAWHSLRFVTYGYIYTHTHTLASASAAAIAWPSLRFVTYGYMYRQTHTH